MEEEDRADSNPLKKEVGMTFFLIMLSVFAVSLLSLLGVLFLAVKEDVLERILLALVALASGALLGGAFLHLLPESAELGTTFDYVLLGIVIFFVVERFLHWRHCHDGKCEIHSFAYMNLIGDGVHNFMDGLIIASSYLVSIPLGIASTIAIIFHEIPQEIGDFGVLVYGGFSKARALLFNFLSALAAVLGALFGYYLGGSIEGFTPIILPFAAGGFIYIATADLMPHLHKERDTKRSLFQLLFLLGGIGLMALTKAVFE